MSATDLLSIQPAQLKFLFEPKKQIDCSLGLTNKTDNHVAFKVKTTNPKKYCVRPNTGIVSPMSSCEIIVTMQAQREAPPDMQCKDKFLLQSTVARPGALSQDINAEMFNKDTGRLVEEFRLKVVYVSPPKLPSPVLEWFEEGSSPRASVSDNGRLNVSEKAQILKLIEERNNAIQQGDRIRRELEAVGCRGGKHCGGVSFTLVVIFGLVGLLMGYFMT